MFKPIKFAAILSLLSLALTGVSAQAAFSPLSVSGVPPVQFPGEDFSITGARLSLGYGHHRDVYGIDIGAIGNITELRFVGTAVSGLFNLTRGTTTVIGLQAAGLTNINTNKTTVAGVQLALFANVNKAATSVTGLQLAIANMSQHTTIYGVQAGIYNKAQDVNGIQIGLVNVAKSLRGIQIGLVNFNQTGLFAVSPLINIGF